MTLLCIQCALEAFVSGVDPNRLRQHASFEETITEHMKRCHPDPVETQKRREELLRLAGIRLGGAFYDVDKEKN